MHFTPVEGRHAHDGSNRGALSRRDIVSQVEMLRSEVHSAKQAAAESLARLNEAPSPHDTANAAFVALFDAHCRDREALFTAMRQLDEAYEALRTAAHRPMTG